jgi:3-keto-5-aminohexanoate cleavage enzyme
MGTRNRTRGDRAPLIEDRRARSFARRGSGPPWEGSMGKLIITVAGVGVETASRMQPGIPVTAAEIGADAARCREAGAAMYRLHGRDANADPTQAMEVFAATIEEIRKRTDIIIQTSTGGAMGMTADERLQPLELDPEMASLTTGTADFGEDVFFNDAALTSELYQRMQKKGVRPEFEIFEASQIDNALMLVRKYGPAGPLMHWDFVLGVPGSMSGEPRNLMFLVDRIPEGSTWTCTGIGRWHMPVTMTALALGGNVRLGFEDNIYLHKGALAKENAELVSRVAWVAQESGRPCATPDEARRILKLGEYDREPARVEAVAPWADDSQTVVP